VLEFIENVNNPPFTENDKPLEVSVVIVRSPLYPLRLVTTLDPDKEPTNSLGGTI
jgi:hypothetical protein